MGSGGEGRDSPCPCTITNNAHPEHSRATLSNTLNTQNMICRNPVFKKLLFSLKWSNFTLMTQLLSQKSENKNFKNIITASCSLVKLSA
jgi:hypothetical protein